MSTPISEACRKIGIAEQTICRWKNKLGGKLPSDMKQLGKLYETTPGKKPAMDPNLDKLILQVILTKKSAVY